MKNRKRNTKLFASVLAIALVLTVGVGGTLAYLIANGGSITNIFNPTQASIQIVETFDETTKEDVYVKNTCEIPVYVRVAIVPTWEDANGNPVGVSASLNDLNIDWGSDKWVEHSDGYWYYKEAVAVDTVTENLIDEATVVTANGYKMNLQIIAEAIQADGVNAQGTKAVFDAWGVDPTTLS